MGMDRDFPITSTQLRFLVVGLVVLAAFGAALFGGAIPGLKPNYSAPAYIVIDDQRYYYTTVFLATPFFPNNSTLPQTFTFENVTFELWVSNWYSSTGGLVHGNGTEPNGTVYPFLLGDSVVPPVNTTLFVSPDRLFAVYWQGGFGGGFWVRLMVHE